MSSIGTGMKLTTTDIVAIMVNRVSRSQSASSADYAKIVETFNESSKDDQAEKAFLGGIHAWLLGNREQASKDSDFLCSSLIFTQKRTEEERIARAAVEAQKEDMADFERVELLEAAERR